VFATIVKGNPKPSVKWQKGRVSIQESSEIKIYYEEESDMHCMEIDNCKTKDAGTYQVSASNEFGTETIPVTLIITKNPEDVIDLKNMLKNKNYGKRMSQTDDPDWGTLKKGGQKLKLDEMPNEKIKLRHIQIDKIQPQEIVEITPCIVRKICLFNFYIV
jgi:hypothetical protein